MANKRRVTIGLATIAVLLAVIAIAALVMSSCSTSGTSVANLPTATAQQDEGTVRAQVYGELTSTAIVLAVTNQAGTIVAMQTQSAPKTTMPQAQVVIPTQSPQLQVTIITATPQPQLPTSAPTILVPTSQPTLAPQIVTATPQPQIPTTAPTVLQPPVQPTNAQPAGGSSATIGTCSRSGDEINVGSTSTGACATVLAADVERIVQNAQTAADAIAHLDRLCETTVNACYQYRNELPSVIPASANPSQRILWGDTGYLIGTSQQNRMRRLKCDTNNQCVYLLTDNQPFIVEYPGRGLLLDQSYQGN